MTEKKNRMHSAHHIAQ